MWLFRKKYPPRADIMLEDEWSFHHGTKAGKPLIARFNLQAKPLIGHPEFTHQVSIAIPLNTPAPNGLTVDEENAQLRGVEEQMRASLQQENESLQVGAITHNGVKEYVFYTANPDGVTAKVAHLRTRITSHTLQLTIQPDEAWSVYKQYT